MANRSNYLLNIHRSGQTVAVHSTNNERIAYVTYDNCRIVKRKLPQYIIDECLNILHATTFELKRGYLISGGSCQINDRRL